MVSNYNSAVLLYMKAFAHSERFSVRMVRGVRQFHSKWRGNHRFKRNCSCYIGLELVVKVTRRLLFFISVMLMFMLLILYCSAPRNACVLSYNIEVNIKCS
jgi:hypothetical protein